MSNSDRLDTFRKQADILILTYKTAFNLALLHVECYDLPINCDDRMPGATCEECKRDYFLQQAKEILEIK